MIDFLLESHDLFSLLRPKQITFLGNWLCNENLFTFTFEVPKYYNYH